MDVIEYIKNSLNLYFGKFEEAYGYVDKEVRWTQALWVTLALGFIMSIISVLVEYVYEPTGFTAIYALTIVFTLLLTPVIILFSTFISYGILYLLFKLFGGKGSFEDTMKFGLSLGILGYFVSIIFSFLPETFFENFSNTRILILILVMLVLIIAFVIWSIIVSVKTFSKLHELSKGKTFLVLIIPAIIVFVLIILLIVILGYFFYV